MNLLVRQSSESRWKDEVVLQDWELGLVGNNPGLVARMPRRPLTPRIVINLVRGRRARAGAAQDLPSAA